MEVQIISQGPNLERQLKIKKKKVIENEETTDENKYKNTIDEIVSKNDKNNEISSDEDEVISFTSNYDFNKHIKSTEIENESSLQTETAKNQSEFHLDKNKNRPENKESMILF